MLSRVEWDDGSATLIDATKKNENLTDQRLHSAAKQLKVLTSIVKAFAADMFYHESCYNRFVYSYEDKSTTKTEMTDGEMSVLSTEKEFKILIKRKILIQKDCYLLADLVEEIANRYEIDCVEGKVDDNKKMKSFLLTNFQYNLQFKPAYGIHENPIIVPSVRVNPVDYAMTLITEAGLRDKDITLTFPKMINHKVKSQELSKSFPFSAKDLMKELDIYDPIKEIFNAVSLPCNPTVPINGFGYASPKSKSNKANKIW